MQGTQQGKQCQLICRLCGTASISHSAKRAQLARRICIDRKPVSAPITTTPPIVGVKHLLQNSLLYPAGFSARPSSAPLHQVTL